MKAPNNPTLVPSNPLHDKYIIQFAPELKNFILKEGKTKTYRYGNKYDYLKIGDKVTLQEYGSQIFIAKAEITNKETVLFKDIPLDLNGHEIYDSKEHQRIVFSSYYKYIGKEIEDNDPFLVISFKLL